MVTLAILIRIFEVRILIILLTKQKGGVIMIDFVYSEYKKNLILCVDQKQCDLFEKYVRDALNYHEVEFSTMKNHYKTVFTTNTGQTFEILIANGANLCGVRANRIFYSCFVNDEFLEAHFLPSLYTGSQGHVLKNALIKITENNEFEVIY